MIKSWIRALALSLLVLTVIATALIAAAWTALPLDRMTLDLGGTTFSLGDVQGWPAVLLFVATVGAVVLAFVLAMVGIVVGLGFGALGIAIGLLATIGSLALVAAPFVLIGWLIWRLVRPRPAAVAIGP